MTEIEVDSCKGEDRAHDEGGDGSNDMSARLGQDIPLEDWVGGLAMADPASIVDGLYDDSNGGCLQGFDYSEGADDDDNSWATAGEDDPRSLTKLASDSQPTAETRSVCLTPA